MPQSPNPDAQRPNQRDYLSFPPIAVFIPAVLGILIALLGTAWRFTLAFKPQQQSQAAASRTTALKSAIIQPTLPKSLTKIHQQNNHLLTQKAVKAKHPISDISTAESAVLHPANTSNSTALGLQTSSELTLFSAITLNSNFAPISLNVSQGSIDDYPTKKISLLGDGRPARPENDLKFELNFGLILDNQTKEIIVQTQIPDTQQPETFNNIILTQNQPLFALKAREVRLTLSDIVILALENNRPIKNAYLERIAQRQELAVAEDKFSPNFTPTVSISIAQIGNNSTTSDADLGLGATVSVKVPTGGDLTFRWAISGQGLSQNALNLNINDDPFAQNLQLSFNQPLLRGYGVNINRASIDLARLTEQVNILDLKSTLIDTITQAIIAYRELIRAQERLKIAQLSLTRAQESLLNNRVLIEAGRLAPVDIVQSETEVARRQVSLIEAQNNLEAARLALLNILDINKSTVIVAADPLTIPAVTLNPDNLRQIALENQPDYLKAQLDLEKTKLAVLQAENNRLWDLNLNTSYGYASTNTSDIRIVLALSRKLGDLTVERDFQRSVVNRMKAENTLVEQQESLEIQLTDRIREVNLNFYQVQLAKKVTQSSEKQLEIAKEKQRLGRDVTIFELVRLQDDLVQARTIELNAIINYLNALTRLDQTLGATLDTWQVTLESK